MTIYTKILDETVRCEHPLWCHVIADGWRFLRTTEEGHVVMMRKGDINEFWEV